jgi:hypothetical protein
MANYNYHCFDCEKAAREQYADHLVVNSNGESEFPIEIYEELVLFETSHAMQPTEEELHEATECPRCHGHNCEKSFYGAQIYGYTKGYGWLDRAGAKRDMNRHKLANDDPYAPYRVDGEVDHIDQQLKKEGQYDPKRKHYLTTPGPHLGKEIDKATSTPAEEE